MPVSKKSLGIIRERKFYWRGRRWVLRALTDEAADLQLRPEGQAGLFSSGAIICYRASLPNDLIIMCILHEVGHELYPQWDSEPSDTSSSEIGTFERGVKAFLEALGVDLTPLL